MADFLDPVEAYLRINYVTARALARHMTAQSSGVQLTLSTPGSQMPGPGHLGYGTTCGAVEAFTRVLAGEIAAAGVRVGFLRPHAIPEASSPHVRPRRLPFASPGRRCHRRRMARRAGARPHPAPRLPRLADVAEYAAFLASDRVAATTGAIANLTCGALFD